MKFLPKLVNSFSQKLKLNRKDTTYSKSNYFEIFNLNDLPVTPDEEDAILDAREEIMREEKKKEEEKKVKMQNEKEQQLNKIEMKKPKELVNGLKYTFDCTGAGLQIKSVLSEKLTNDFILSK
jgi:hypothetical protein